MKHRNIYFIEDEKRLAEQDIAYAAQQSMDQNFSNYLDVIRANYAMMNIDVIHFPVKRVISYIETDES